MFCPLHWYTHTIMALHSFNEPLYILWIFLKKTIHWLRHYHKKEGKFSFCFGRIIISTIRLFSFIDPHKVIGWVLLTIHLHYLLFVLKNLTQNQLSTATASVIIKWLRGIIVCFVFCIDTLMKLCCYIYLINLFYFINFLQT